jgi:hypothetical protein
MARTKTVSLMMNSLYPANGKGVVGNVDIHHLGQHLSGVGTGEVDHPHGVGQIHQVKIPVVETGVIADPLHVWPALPVEVVK